MFACRLLGQTEKFSMGLIDYIPKFLLFGHIVENLSHFETNVTSYFHLLKYLILITFHELASLSAFAFH